MAIVEDERAAALRRKANAMEAAGSDPTKVAEIRALLPVERHAEPKQTVAKSDESKVEETHKTDPDAPKRGPGRPRMSATRGDNK